MSNAVAHRYPRPPASSRELALAVTLAMRCIVNAWFALWLITLEPGWFDIFRIGSMYALADGALGFLSVLLLAPGSPVGSPPLLQVTTFADALLRISAGVALRLLPGIPDFPVTEVAFFGAIGACAAFLGLIALVSWLVRAFHHSRGPQAEYVSAHALFDPLAITGLLALMLGLYTFVSGPPSTVDGLRVAAACWSAALGLAFLIAAVGALPRHPHVAAA
jgi:hypothetical protein